VIFVGETEKIHFRYQGKVYYRRVQDTTTSGHEDGQDVTALGCKGGQDMISLRYECGRDMIASAYEGGQDMTY
jgi:hypothetical protein